MENKLNIFLQGAAKNIHPSIHHLFKQSEQTYKKSKSVKKHIHYGARCQGTRRA